MSYRDYTESWTENVKRNRTISDVPVIRGGINQKLENYGTFPDGTNYLFLTTTNASKYNAYQFFVDFTENYGMYLRAKDIILLCDDYRLERRLSNIMCGLACAFPFGNKIEFYCNEEPFPFWRNYYHISNYVLFTELSGWDGEEQLFLNKISGKITPDIFAENPGKREIFLNSVFSQICKIRPFLDRIVHTDPPFEGRPSTARKIWRILEELTIKQQPADSYESEKKSTVSRITGSRYRI